MTAAWRALAGAQDGKGWRTIAIDAGERCRVLAGRHFVGGEEAILVGFAAPGRPAAPDSLPQGRGFLVESVRSAMPNGDRRWVALVRRSAGSLEMFAAMAGDIISVVGTYQGDDASLYRAFLGRIRAWQTFMERERDAVLDSAEEIGLVGELMILEALLDGGVSAREAVDGWRGPADGLHDFVLGGGAVEVKTTMEAARFPVVVSSLEQLDDRLEKPLFLAGVRLALADDGRTLPTFVAGLQDRMAKQPAVRAAFEALAIQAGFLARFADRYGRRFRHVRTLVFEIGDGFPRLIRGNVDPAIQRVRYRMDLDLVKRPVLQWAKALSRLTDA